MEHIYSNGIENKMYSNGSFDVFEFTWRNIAGQPKKAYGIRRADRPQDGMIFAHTDYDYVIRIADKYKKELGRGDNVKLKDEQLNWIYQNIDEFKKAVITLDYLQIHKRLDSTLRNNINDNILSMALSFLMVAMGDNIPKDYWQVDDYSVLYGVLDAHKNDDGMNLRDYD